MRLRARKANEYLCPRQAINQISSPWENRFFRFPVVEMHPVSLRQLFRDSSVIVVLPAPHLQHVDVTLSPGFRSAVLARVCCFRKPHSLHIRELFRKVLRRLAGSDESNADTLAAVERSPPIVILWPAIKRIGNDLSPIRKREGLDL